MQTKKRCSKGGVVDMCFLYRRFIGAGELGGIHSMIDEGGD